MKRPALGALAASAAFLLAGQAGADCLIKFAELPVTMVGTRPIVHVEINGVDEPFLADSGAFYSFITPGSAAQLGLHLTPAPFGMMVRGVGGVATMSVARVKQFKIAGAQVANAEFLVGGSEIGEGAIGTLGQNLFGLYDVEYDLADGVIRLARPQGCGRRPLAYWVKTPTFSEMDIGDTTAISPHTTGSASVNGHEIRVMFDTGAATSMFALAAARRAGIDPDGPGVVPAGLSGGIGRKMVRTWIAPVDTFVVGGEQIRHTRIRIGDTPLLDVDMLLGADFFLSHRVYVAKSQHRLYFTYNGGPVFNLASKPQELTPTPDAATKPQAGAETNAPVDAPKDAEAFSRRGAAFAARRDFDRAIADFTRACEMAPTKPRYLYQRAMARLGNRQPVLAMGDLDQALKLQPDDITTLVARAELRLSARDTKDALTDLDAAARLAPREADVRFSLGELYLGADAFPLAIAQFDQWIRAHPDDSRRAMALGGRCWARAMSGADLTAALADCDGAVKANPRNPGALDSRGLVHLRLGDFDKAIADFDAALAARPKFPWGLYGRGVAKLKKGQTAQGNADIAAAEALQPKLAEEAKGRGIAP